jgi:hypothetical protein
MSAGKLSLKPAPTAGGLTSTAPFSVSALIAATGISRRLPATLYAGTFSHNTKIAQHAGFCQPLRNKIFRLSLSLSLALLHGGGSFNTRLATKIISSPRLPVG